MSVFVIRAVPGVGQTGDVRGSHSDFTGNQGWIGILAVSSAADWRSRDLVGGSHRLDSCGSYGDSLLCKTAEVFLKKRTVCTSAQPARRIFSYRKELVTRTLKVSNPVREIK